MSIPRTTGLAAECLLALACARIALRLAPQRALRGALDGEASAAPADPRVVAAFARAAARAPFAHNCMHRSLALQRVLARRGVRARLRIGLGAKPSLLPGHAWLEVNGAVVNDSAELVSRYQPIHIAEQGLALAYRR
ncbi:MAG TPA: lasso peptide biosynthesis B2 protein [Thermoanaerobaculia bacterium]